MDSNVEVTNELAGNPKATLIWWMENEPNYDWEAVYTFHDYYDGPRKGIADYRGKAHAYECEWDGQSDDWSETFLLSPITNEQLNAVKERWLIWQRYKANFHAGNLQPGDKHPALAGDWPRYTELSPIVDDAMRVDVALALRAIPEFIGALEPTTEFWVRWRLV
ncbi:hypothetical protein [Mesorhizobium loti]|uniref:hypothetical protein n=1 Tax=Rhizobium loti TaxID=381 RepID=UPI0006859C90|nr:hypothetical protein [Mesorhizobium loti]